MRGLGAGHGELGDVYALALLRPVPGAGRQGRGVRLLEVQLRHADHEARRDGPRELLDRVMNNYRRFYMRKALSHYPWIRDKSAEVHVGCLKASRNRLPAHVLRSGQGRLLGSAVEEESRFPLRRARARMAPGTDAVASDDGWVTVHGPTIANRRRRRARDPPPWRAAAARSRSRTPGPAVDRARPGHGRTGAAGAHRAECDHARRRRAAARGRRRAGARSVRGRPARALPPRSARQHGRRGRSDPAAPCAAGGAGPAIGRGALRAPRAPPPATTSSRGASRAPSSAHCACCRRDLRHACCSPPSAATPGRSRGAACSPCAPVGRCICRSPAIRCAAAQSRRTARRRDYYAATFERLFRRSSHPRATVTEAACEACGAYACRFEIRW